MKNKLEGITMEKDTEKSRKKRLVTAALPYINNVPHLGHIVGSHLPADIFARYSRLKGYDTLFIGGTDENGSTSEIASYELGVPLDEFSDKLHEKHKEIYDWFGISYDNFSRTTKKIHHDTVKQFFSEIYENGYVSQGKTKVFYSSKSDMFLPDRYVVGECPKCEYEEAKGDQCEKCTSLLDPLELGNPRSAISGEELEIKETDHLFLNLDKISPQLEKWIESQNQWRPDVKGIANGWINEGLRPRGITRDLKHGVEVPLEGFENKVFYVWFDAPIGYISSTKEASEKWDEYLKGEGSEIYNFLGKDNIPFHTIFWPAMLMANKNYNLPSNVLGLQYLNYEGKKFSKSKNVGVFCENLHELDIEPDVWRHYLSQVIPEYNDTEFKWEEFKERVNSQLIGNFGNYANRIINFTNKKFSGEIKEPQESELRDEDKVLFENVSQKEKNIENLLEKSEIRRAYSEILAVSSEGNKYLHDTKPWEEIKNDPERANHILYNGAVVLKDLAILMAPYLPNASNRVWNQLDLSGTPSDKGSWDYLGKSFGETHYLGKPEILFSKIEDKDIDHYKEKASKPTDLKKFFRK